MKRLDLFLLVLIACSPQVPKEVQFANCIAKETTAWVVIQVGIVENTLKVYLVEAPDSSGQGFYGATSRCISIYPSANSLEVTFLKAVGSAYYPYLRVRLEEGHLETIRHIDGSAKVSSYVAEEIARGKILYQVYGDEAEPVRIRP